MKKIYHKPHVFSPVSAAHFLCLTLSIHAETNGTKYIDQIKLGLQILERYLRRAYNIDRM